MLKTIYLHVLEYAWIYALGVILFVILPSWAAAARRRNRRALRVLLGADLPESRMFVRGSIGIGVDEKSKKFAVVAKKVRIVCPSSELNDIKFVTENKLGGVLEVLTSNHDLPRLFIETAFKTKRLGEIYSRLLSIQNKSEAPSNLSFHEPSAGEALSPAMRDLTAAVNRLVDVLSEKPARRVGKEGGGRRSTARGEG